MNGKLFTLLGTVRLAYDAFSGNYYALKEHPFTKETNLYQRVKDEIAANNKNNSLLNVCENYEQLIKACEVTARMTIIAINDAYTLLRNYYPDAEILHAPQYGDLKDFPQAKARLEAKIKNEQPSPEELTKLYISFVGSRSFARYVSDCKFLRGESKSYSPDLDKFFDFETEQYLAEKLKEINHTQN